jgi:hypothetical protein
MDMMPHGQQEQNTPQLHHHHHHHPTDCPTAATGVMIVKRIVLQACNAQLA